MSASLRSSTRTATIREYLVRCAPSKESTRNTTRRYMCECLINDCAILVSLWTHLRTISLWYSIKASAITVELSKKRVRRGSPPTKDSFLWFLVRLLVTLVALPTDSVTTSLPKEPSGSAPLPNSNPYSPYQHRNHFKLNLRTIREKSKKLFSGSKQWPYLANGLIW